LDEFATWLTAFHQVPQNHIHLSEELEHMLLAVGSTGAFCSACHSHLPCGWLTHSLQRKNEDTKAQHATKLGPALTLTLLCFVLHLAICLAFSKAELAMCVKGASHGTFGVFRLPHHVATATWVSNSGKVQANWCPVCQTP